MRDGQRWVQRLALGVGAAAILVSLLLQSNRVRSVALLFPAVSGFIEAAPRVWVERGTTEAARSELVQTVAAARRRVDQFYPRAAGHPVVLACSTVECFRRCGGIGHATTFFSDRVLLSPGGVNSVKVSHELSHVELATRIGAVRALLSVPQWFDEGLAVLASDDPDYDEAKWLAATEVGARVPNLEQMATLRGFLAATKQSKQAAYGTARHEVARWYARVGAAGLERLFSAVRGGESFRYAYARVEEGAGQ